MDSQHLCLFSVQEKQAAAKHLDLALKTTPWTLTDNYVSRERENKGAQMAFAGPGDPTGKGRGFSFVKDTRKVGSCLLWPAITQDTRPCIPLGFTLDFPLGFSRSALGSL